MSDDLRLPLAVFAAQCCRRWRERAIGLLYPAACVGCGSDFGELPPMPLVCDLCASAMREGYLTACERCAAPLGSPGQACHECHQRQHRFSQAIALGKYDGLLRRLVLRAKSAADESLALALGRSLATKLATGSHAQSVDAIVPIPVPRLRRLLRTGNVSEVLAEAISVELGLSRCDQALRYCRRVKQQHNLTPAQRRRNVRGALVADPARDFRGAKLLVVDDVLTTGATADEAARALLAAGAASVAIAVVARGVGYD